jgi:hypothetical protein
MMDIRFLLKANYKLKRIRLITGLKLHRREQSFTPVLANCSTPSGLGSFTSKVVFGLS